MKLTFGLIVFNGGFFLKQVLETIYPFAHRICIAEGPVKYWQDKGFVSSTDNTQEIIRSFPDPQRKIFSHFGQYEEKTNQCQTWFRYVPQDTEYVFCVDADEVHRPEDIEKLIFFLERNRPTSVGFKSDTFFGGFDRIIGGFERSHSFKRVLKYAPGYYYLTHRQPTLAYKGIEIPGRNVTGNELYEWTGITMPHYSYVSPKMVHQKLQYYEDQIISKGNCIPNYFTDLWLKWVNNPDQREDIEKQYKGVQEFTPETRGSAYTEPFQGKHPEVIQRDLLILKQQFDRELDSLR